MTCDVPWGNKKAELQGKAAWEFAKSKNRHRHLPTAMPAAEAQVSITPSDRGECHIAVSLRLLLALDVSLDDDVHARFSPGPKSIVHLTYGVILRVDSVPCALVLFRWTPPQGTHQSASWSCRLQRWREALFFFWWRRRNSRETEGGSHQRSRESGSAVVIKPYLLIHHSNPSADCSLRWRCNITLVLELQTDWYHSLTWE